MGFSEMRVQRYDAAARIEVLVRNRPEVVSHHEANLSPVKAADYRFITVDFARLTFGRLNGLLKNAQERSTL